MPLLARFLQFLRFLEGLLEFLDFLATPLGLIATVGLGLYGVFTFSGMDASISASLAGSVALVLSCIITRPDF
jgi:hypothetical protein